MNADELKQYAQENGERFWRDAGQHWLNDSLDLNPNSLVTEIGGYLGNWTDYVQHRYECWINVYEPVKEYADKMVRRFGNRTKIHVLPAAVGYSNGSANIAVMNEGSTFYTPGAVVGPVVPVVDAAEIAKYGIDLLAINSEGSEYGILDRLIETGTISNVNKLLVQFHASFPDAEEHRNAIREKVFKTHYEQWAYPFCWEMWVRK